ncbi:putative spermidine/putrescine transport system ATP-binding protein [Neorhizobium galegae]|uniref:ABC transporter ATP-binding protein n=1 Tax=Neorhizobium galegae TaxID=399 RepID=UPI00277EB798|nr:ABC transporter ATP-binding protein [Neorhizobium galegae]MDQ0134130.1 putative spermidine/putrescine transport system ATP-binding protein [Neorhizobium galegae]
MPAGEVQVDRVMKRYGPVQAVQNVSLNVRGAEFLSLLGPSGCGKTTLLRMIAGFETPTEGRIMIDGADVTKVPTYRRPIGMVMQSLALFPHMDVRENVTFGLILRKESRAIAERKAEDALAMVGLAGYGDRLVHQLSGGQKQRVALARSLVTEPAVLLLDEPLSALDLKLRQQMQEELKRIQKRVGTTFIFVTHDQEEAMTMSDRIAVVNEGQIEQVGSPQEIYDSPASLFVANFVGDTNVLQAEVLGSDASGTQVRLLGTGEMVNARGAAFAQGARVELMVRPDYLRLNSPGAGTGLTGTITERTFVGNTTRYLVSVNGREMKVRVPHSPEDNGFMPGQDVLITWPSGGCVALPSTKN